MEYVAEEPIHPVDGHTDFLGDRGNTHVHPILFFVETARESGTDKGITTIRESLGDRMVRGKSTEKVHTELPQLPLYSSQGSPYPRGLGS